MTSSLPYFLKVFHEVALLPLPLQLVFFSKEGYYEGCKIGDRTKA
jgi:hypothetical protein